jgi:hypothetical protein
VTNRTRSIALITLLGLAATIAGCQTAKQKTAPCKRPANRLSYALEPIPQFSAAAGGCGAMRPVNTGPLNATPYTAFEAIDALTADREPG